MKIKTSELTGPALDWAVAKCENTDNCWGRSAFKPYEYYRGINYSTDWAQGGPIIERESIAVRKHSSGTWYAMKSSDLGDSERAQWTKFHWITQSEQKGVRFEGHTPLVAAMRCYVASKLGDKVNVPEEAL
jgi:hypothetical protein